MAEAKKTTKKAAKTVKPEAGAVEDAAKAKAAAKAAKTKSAPLDEATPQSAAQAIAGQEKAADAAAATVEAATDAADTADTDTAADKGTAKAGKRSAKAQKEAEAEAAKEVRKARRAEAEASEEKSEGPKPRPKTRSKLERAGKKYRQAASLLEADKLYTLAEAMEAATKTSVTKFDATVEMHVRLGIDPRQADQNLRDNFVLPAGTGKAVRVAVFAEADDAAAAKKAGADITGNEEFLQLLDKQKIEFDILIATPGQMPKLGKYARLLGPKGLMPNPKSGTVTTDVAKAVEQAKAGRVEYRVDSTGIVHLGIGKVSFGTDKLLQNAQAVAASIKNNKPSSVKGTYVKSIHITTTMGPSIPVAQNEI